GWDHCDWTYFSGAAQRPRTALDKIDLDWRHFREPQHLIVVKVGLHGLPLVKGDLRLECRRKAPSHPALNIVGGDVGIQRGTAVNNANDAMNLHIGSPD